MKYQKTLLLLLLTAITCSAQVTRVGSWQVATPTNLVSVLATNRTLENALCWIDEHWPTNIPNEEVATLNALQQLEIDLANTSETMRLEWKADVSNGVSNVNARIDGMLDEWPYVFTYVSRRYWSDPTGIYVNAQNGFFTNIAWKGERYSSTNLQSAWIGNDAAFIFPTSGMWMAQVQIVLQKMPVQTMNDFMSWVLLYTYENDVVVSQDTIGAAKMSQTPHGVGYNGTVLIPVRPDVETKCKLVHASCDYPFQIRRLIMAFYYLGR